MSDSPARKSAGSPVDKSVVSQNFKLVFLTVAGLTLLFAIFGVVLAFCHEKEAADKCLTMAAAGFGAIVGLLGGKSL